MCGIVGYIGENQGKDVVVKGLESLEYRGYDSSGIATIDTSGLEIFKSVGKLQNLKKLLENKVLESNICIGHTRWATHGEPNNINAHPHISSKIAVVHNGIIENFIELKESLKQKGYTFISETDTETIAHLIDSFYNGDIKKAVLDAISCLTGAYAIAVICEDEPDKIIAFRKHSPLVLGKSKNQSFIASDVPALLGSADSYIYLENNTGAVLSKDSIDVFDTTGSSIEYQETILDISPDKAEKDGYPYFMLKEIFEQPETILATFNNMCKIQNDKISIPSLDGYTDFLKGVDSVHFISCGTSLNASSLSKYFFNDFAKMKVDVSIASEFRYDDPVISDKTLYILASQSGETADTLEVLRMLKSQGAKVFTVCNVAYSSMAREAHASIITSAGIEIGVASTKAFTAQIISLYIFALFIAQIKNLPLYKKLSEYIDELYTALKEVKNVLSQSDSIKEIAEQFKGYKKFLYLGRNINYALAQEGSLKLKELSYIHAEAYAAGEMKHGPIALIDDDMPTLFIATENKTHSKTLSNIQEIKARKGVVVVITTKGLEIPKNSEYIFEINKVGEYLQTLPTTVFMQLFSYYVADSLGLDIDKPRNLAKSVTVE